VLLRMSRVSTLRDESRSFRRIGKKLRVSTLRVDINPMRCAISASLSRRRESAFPRRVGIITVLRVENPQLRI